MINQNFIIGQLLVNGFGQIFNTYEEEITFLKHGLSLRYFLGEFQTSQLINLNLKRF